MENQYKIGDRTYSYGVIPASKAVILEIEIAKLIGEPLFKAFITAAEGTEPKDNMDTAGVAIGLLCSKADSASFLKMLNTVFEHTSCNGQRIEIDATFTGRNREMLQVFIYGLRFNFRDFFPDSLFASIRAKMGAALPTSNQQT